MILIGIFSFIGGAQEAEQFLIYENFESITPPSWPLGWTFQDANGDLKVWETKKYGGLPVSPQCVRYSSDATNVANDWFFSHNINLDVGITYKLSFRYKVTPSSIHKMNIWLGNTPSSSGMTSQIFDNPSMTDTAMTEVTVDFIPPASGIYYVGFHCYSDAASYYVYVDDIIVSRPTTEIRLSVGFPDELTDLQSPPIFNFTDEIECIAIIENTGTSEILLNDRFTIGGAENLKSEISYIITDPLGIQMPFGLLIEEAPEPMPENFKAFSPGNRKCKIFDLQNPFSFSLTGTYTIRVLYKSYHKHPGGLDVWLGRILSSPVTFIIQ
jgi:hypothetical protein